MIVVDASVWLAALLDAGPTGDSCRAVLQDDLQWIMPGHCPLEVLRALGKYELAGKISAASSSALAEAVWRARPQIVVLGEVELKAVWGMRHNVSVYDAAYVVIALMYDVDLVTCDQRLARAVADLGTRVRLLQ